jgi:hypothetical protein
MWRCYCGPYNFDVNPSLFEDLDENIQAYNMYINQQDAQNSCD